MIELILPISVAVVVIIISILYVFFIKKKPDVIDSHETKYSTTVSKQSHTTNKKGKKKSGKKGFQNEGEMGNSFDDSPSENNRNENIILLETKKNYEAVEELVVPLKSSEENAALDKKKRKSKVKNLSGDQLSTEIKTSDVERNENQSNTLLGRSNEDKLQEENQALKNKLEVLNKEREKTDSEITVIKNSIQLKERDNENLKSDLTKIKSELHSEKERISKALSEAERSKTDLENEKTQKMRDNESHTEMYRKYESKIEQLKNDLKSHQNDLSNLNKKLKEEIEKFEAINKKYNEVNSILQGKLEEVKVKDSNLNKLQEMNNSLRKMVEDLQREKSTKDEEISKIRNTGESYNNKLMNTIKQLEQESKTKTSEIINVKNHESILSVEVSEMRDQIDVLNGKCRELEKQLDDSEKINNLKMIEMDENNTRLQVIVHKLEKDMEVSRHTIHELEEANTRLIEKNSNDVDEVLHSCAIREEEIKKISSESFNELGKIITEKDHEITVLKSNIDDLTKENAFNKKLQHDMSEQKESLFKELSSLKQLVGDSQKHSTEHGDIHTKYEESVNKNKQLEIEVSNLNSQCQKYDQEIKNLTTSKKDLFDNLSSVNMEIKELKDRVVVKEEGSVCQNSDTGKSQEIESLSEELRSKELQVENLEHETLSLQNKIESLELISRETTDTLNSKITELEQEVVALREKNSANVINEEIHATEIVPLNSECNSHVSNDLNEVDNLKSHIMKLENELKSMQGRYYNLKDDHMKVSEVRHTNERVKSETNVISIPPTINDDCAPIILDSDTNGDIRSTTQDSLHEAINRLNSEIEEQRLKNQKLSGHLKSKESEVNVLKQCLLGLDGSLNKIGIMANDLQKSCLVTESEKNTVKCQHESLIKDHESLRQRYFDLEKKWAGLDLSIHASSNHDDTELSEKMIILHRENQTLRAQLEHYRDSLEKTEKMLEKIQSSVDKEEADWTTALRSSEEECNQLQKKVKELTDEIDELKSDNATDASNMASGRRWENIIDEEMIEVQQQNPTASDHCH